MHSTTQYFSTVTLESTAGGVGYGGEGGVGDAGMTGRAICTDLDTKSTYDINY